MASSRYGLRFCVWILLFLDVQENTFAEDGQWSEWNEWGPCSASCDKGTRKRIRFCNSPPPSDGGASCPGSRSQKGDCGQVDCAVDGAWSDWGNWRECSVTCGEGTRSRSRECNSPSPLHGGRVCDSSGQETEICVTEDCRVDGQWSAWSPWSQCSVTCGGGGTQVRKRLCNNPAPSVDGKPCKGGNSKSKRCKANVECPVDGAWSDWGVWSECSVTCGEGIRSRSRECDSPAPLHGGRVCEGGAEEAERCFSRNCPIDGQWSVWSPWSECSVTCEDGGTQLRFRSCNNPTPSADGKPCQGSDKQDKKCSVNVMCPVDGQWSKWSEWSACSATCGQGVRSRFRKCDNPPPQNGGLDCSQAAAGVMQEISCNGTIAFCPVDGGWSEWGQWGECTSPHCTDLHYMMRTRTCSNPYPAHRGSMCQGPFLNASLCDWPVNCQIDGQWGEWSGFTCFEDYASRSRKCDNPPPTKGGRQCDGSDEEEFLKEDNPKQFELICGERPTEEYEDNEILGEEDKNIDEENNKIVDEKENINEEELH